MQWMRNAGRVERYTSDAGYTVVRDGYRGAWSVYGPVPNGQQTHLAYADTLEAGKSKAEQEAAGLAEALRVTQEAAQAYRAL